MTLSRQTVIQVTARLERGFDQDQVRWDGMVAPGRVELPTFGLGIGDALDPDVEPSENPPNHVASTGPGSPSCPTLAQDSDPIEGALSDALRAATAADQWTLVAQLASELEARRRSRAGVVELDKERKRRGQP